MFPQKSEVITNVSDDFAFLREHMQFSTRSKIKTPLPISIEPCIVDHVFGDMYKTAKFG
jgi:hypothetical protein